VDSPSRLTEFIGCAEFRSGERYRKDFQNVLAQRGTRLCVVTKAHYILRRLHEDDYDIPLAAFHDLADNRLQLPQSVILAGNAPILRMRNRQAELDLHTTAVFVWPLEAADRREFLALLKTYERMLEGLIEEGALVRNAEAIFAAIKGCDGWLRRALIRALALLAESSILSWTAIQRQLPTPAEQSVLHDEIALLRSAASGEALGTSATGPASASGTTSKRRMARRRVGERNPARDRVGSS